MTDVPRWLRDVPLAHRGLHGEQRPENSLAAFEAARAAGVGVELDVWCAADGVAVVTHDADLRRVTGAHRRVGATTSEELAVLRLAGTDQHLPTLVQAMAVLGDTPTMVEVKNPGVRPGSAEPSVLRAMHGHTGPWCIASFNPRTVGWFARHAPDVVRVQTAGPMADVAMPPPVRWSLRTLRWNAMSRPHAVAYDIRGIDHAAVQRLRRDGATVLTWTVRTHADLDLAREHADNMIFEHPITPLDATAA